MYRFMECTNDAYLYSTDLWNVLTSLFYAVLIGDEDKRYSVDRRNVETPIL